MQTEIKKYKFECDGDDCKVSTIFECEIIDTYGFFGNDTIPDGWKRYHGLGIYKDRCPECVKKFEVL